MSMPGDFGRDDDDEGGMHDARGPAVTELVGRIGNLFQKRRLSPPFDIRRAAGFWLGSLTQDEIVDVIEEHFERCQMLPGIHASGSGDATFNMLKAAINKAIDSKLAWGRPADEVERPRRKRRGGCVKFTMLAGRTGSLTAAIRTGSAKCPSRSLRRRCPTRAASRLARMWIPSDARHRPRLAAARDGDPRDRLHPGGQAGMTREARSGRVAPPMATPRRADPKKSLRQRSEPR